MRIPPPNYPLGTCEAPAGGRRLLQLRRAAGPGFRGGRPCASEPLAGHGGYGGGGDDGDDSPRAARSIWLVPGLSVGFKGNLSVLLVQGHSVSGSSLSAFGRASICPSIAHDFFTAPSHNTLGSSTILGLE